MSTTNEEGGAFWEKQERETATQYAAFCVYRDQGIGRSLRRAAFEFYDRDEADGGRRKDPVGTPNPAALRRFKEWSSEHLWQARVEAFDLEEARARSLRRQQERDEMLDRHRNIALLGEKLASKVIFALLRDEGYLPPSALPSLINSSTQLHRLSLGEPSEITENRDPDQRTPDYSALSDEEIELLDEIGKKLYGGG